MKTKYGFWRKYGGFLTILMVILSCPLATQSTAASVNAANAATYDESIEIADGAKVICDATTINVLLPKDNAGNVIRDDNKVVVTILMENGSVTLMPGNTGHLGNLTFANFSHVPAENDIKINCP